MKRSDIGAVFRNQIGPIAARRFNGRIPQEESYMYKATLAALAATTVLFAGSAMAQQQPDWAKIQINGYCLSIRYR